MKHLFSCTFVAALALIGVALDSKTWSLVSPGLPDVPLIESEPAYSGGAPIVPLSENASNEAPSPQAAAQNVPTTAHATLRFDHRYSERLSYAYTCTTLPDNATYLLASGEDRTEMASVYSALMGMGLAHTSLLDHAGVAIPEGTHGLLIRLTITYADGSTHTHTLPLAVTTKP